MLAVLYFGRFHYFQLDLAELWNIQMKSFLVYGSLAIISSYMKQASLGIKPKKILFSFFRFGLVTDKSRVKVAPAH